MDLTILCPLTGKVVFSHSELVCGKNDPKHGEGYVPAETRARYGLLRFLIRDSIWVNSCCRSKVYNDSIAGASSRSNHVFDEPYYRKRGGIAMDIGYRRGNKKRSMGYIENLITKAWELGFSIGIYNTFLHIDDRTVIDGRPQVVFKSASYDGRYDHIVNKITVKIPPITV